MYNRDFQFVDAKLAYENAPEKATSKPKNYEVALKIAEKLGAEFDFIRVDLYLTDDGVYFGELTNTPGNGFERFWPKSLDFELGSALPPRIDR